MDQMRVRLRVVLMALVLGGGCFAAVSAGAVEVRETLSDKELPKDWLKLLSEKSAGAITSGANGALLKAEYRNYVLLKRRNNIVGTDRRPLSVSVYVASERGYGRSPGLHLYWDNNNFISLLYTVDKHFYVHWANKGRIQDRPFYNVLPDARPRKRGQAGAWYRYGGYLRAVLTSANVFLFVSRDGVNWRRVGNLGERPGAPGAAPGSILLGRGWEGERNGKAHAYLANDYYPDKNKKLIASLFRDFQLHDTPRIPPPALPERKKDADWKTTLKAMEAAGVPRNWLLLGPIPDRNFRIFRRKDGLEPDRTDDWKTPPKDLKGRPFRRTQWERPDDAEGCYVELSEILDPDAMVLAYARTEIKWPSAGPAMLWFDCNGQGVVYLNNKKIFNPEERQRNWNRYGARKDRWAIPVYLKRGVNVLKIKSGQRKGAWGFYLRVERNDPGYRIRLLERLLELYPREAKGWRGAEARMEIARRFEQMMNFPLALEAYRKALAAFKDNDEYRGQALGGQLRLLESLRDWPKLAKAAAQYLQAFGRGAGVRNAQRALLLGRVMQGQLAAAEARAQAWLKEADPNGARVTWLLRALAGAFESAGVRARQWAALEELARRPEVERRERARAALEAAFSRCHVEYENAYHSRKINEKNLADACRAARQGLALLPGRENPQARLYAKEAEFDLKAGKYERAVMGYWGAALHALVASDPQAAELLALRKAYTLPSVGVDPKTKKARDLNSAKKELEKQLGAAVDGVKWLGKWRAIGPFENKNGVGERTAYGPEKNPDFKAQHAGRGGKKKWIELDPKKNGHEYGQRLEKFLGNCKGGLAYLARDFETGKSRETFLRLAMRAGWYAWLDGKPIGSKPGATFRIDADRVSLKLAPGKHRLLLKLVCPGDGLFTYRVRISPEPEMAVGLLVQTWLARELPNPRLFYEHWNDLWWWVRFAHGKTNAATVYTLGNSIATLYPAHTGIRWDASYWVFDRVREYGEQAEAAAAFRKLLVRLETWADYPARASQIWYAAGKLSESLRAEGEPAAADEVLSQALARYPGSPDAVANALISRATLRLDYTRTRESRRFYERAVREYPWSYSVTRYGPSGLAYVRRYRPERMMFETRHEIQAIMDTMNRQMQVGARADVERAMRNLGEVLRTGSEALIRISNSRFRPKYVGVREYIRARLAHLGEETLAIYRKTVAHESERRYRSAAAQRDSAALEAVAGEYHYTRAAARALNRAGNLYLDRGKFAQAASSFKLLLRDYRGMDGLSEPLIAAKIARALMRSGQSSSAARAVQRLAKDYGARTFLVGGRRATGKAYAAILRERLDRAKNGTGQPTVLGKTQTFAGNARRSGVSTNGPAPVPGPLKWSRPLVSSESLDVARTQFWPDPFPHLSAYPVAAHGRLFVGSLEGLCALSLQTGRREWSRTWGSSGRLLPRKFSGFPVSCPTFHDGKLYLRVLMDKHSALQCFDAKSGKVCWSTAVVPELQRAVWLSDPLIAYGLAIAAYLEPGDMNSHGVAAMDARTGRFRWKRQLVTGNAGIKIQGRYYGSSMQLGPPAADAGIIYTSTGLNTVAALNAFTGEVVWLSGYTRLDIHSLDNGNSGISNDFKMRFLKLLARGPVSPVVGENILVVAPKDAPGILGIERRGGKIRWQHELLSARYLAGLNDGRVLVVDNTVKALDMESGAVAWEYALLGEDLYGRPGYSGGVLYLPTEKRLLRLDARTGNFLGARPWDPRLGPLANLLVTPERIVGVNEQVVAALGPQGSPRVELPLEEGRAHAAKGEWEAAAERFARAAQMDPDNVLPALSGRVKSLQRLGKAKQALADIDRLLAGKPATLRSPGGLWQVSKTAFAEALKARLGQPFPAPKPLPLGKGGLWGYAWQIPGKASKIYHSRNIPAGRLLILAGNHLQMVRQAPHLDLFWKSYVGPDTQGVSIGRETLVVRGTHRLRVLDFRTGERLGQIALPTDRKHRRIRADARNFGGVATNDELIAAIAGRGLFVYDRRTLQEVWSNQRRYRGTLSLSFVGNRLVEVFGERRKPSYYVAYDARTGRRLTQVLLTKRFDHGGGVRSPDGRLLVIRQNYTQMLGVDLASGKKLWEIRVPRLDNNRRTWNGLGLRFENNMISYFGEARGGKRRGWRQLYLDPKTGKVLHEQGGGAYKLGSSWLTFRERYGKVIVRTDESAKGQKKNVWKTVLNERSVYYQSVRRVFRAGDYLYVLYIRASGGDRFILRTFDWPTGQLLDVQDLPGTPIRNERGRGFRGVAEQDGPLFFVGAHEGLFAYTPMGDTRMQIARKLRQALAGPGLSAREHREARRALAPVEPVTVQAFLAPKEVKVDGDLNEWKGSEPLLLKRRAQYAPLGPRFAWGGPADLSAKVHAGWNAEGLLVAVEVQDDRFTPPLPGAALTSGDSLHVALNALSEPSYGYDRGENLLCSLALVDGRTVLSLHGKEPDGPKARPKGRVIRSPDGKGLRYELRLPWALLRRDPRRRPGRYKKLYAGVAVYDADGALLKGAMEWGAGITSPRLSPVRLGRLFLLDISKEKIERYRKVIAKIPDASESLRFLELILKSKRGLKANPERRKELEAFIKAHPKSVHATRALGLLLSVYKRLKVPDALAAVVKAARAAHCPAYVLDNIAGKALRVWVHPDSKQPPKMIMVQINTPRRGWNYRAYWGEARVSWGREGTPQRKRLGAIPPPGKWTLLEIRPVEFGLEEEDIRAVAFTSFGGLTHWDRASYVVAGKEKVFLDEAIPPKFRREGNAIKFVNAPVKAGRHAWTAGRTKGLLNTHLFPPGNKTWFSFKSPQKPKPPAPDPKKLQALYREAAGLVYDTPEGYAFLRYVLDRYRGKDAVQKRIGECEAYLQKYRHTPNALSILEQLRGLYASEGERNPQFRCEDLMLTLKLPRDIRRAFYTRYVSGWTDWRIIGPFPAVGERRGLDQVMAPEKRVDLKWKPKGPFETELSWKRITGHVDRRTKKISSYVDLYGRLLAGLEKKQSRQLTRSPYFAYAYRKFSVPSRRRAVFFFGVNDMLSIWINGRRVVTERAPGRDKDRAAVEVKLPDGDNEILVKAGVRQGKLGFYFRLADENGRPFDDLPRK